MIQLSRFTLGLAWIYHGLFPKLLFLAPLELEMSGSFGFSEENTLLLIRAAGISEIIFGLLLIVCYRVRALHYLNIAGLTALLLFVLAMTPHIMTEAFNPVTTNIPLLVLSLILLKATADNGAPRFGAELKANMEEMSKVAPFPKPGD